jgi:CHAT domain-containing protein
MKGKLEVYEGLVRLYLDHASGGRRLEEAFACMEQAKSRSLRDVLIAGPAVDHAEGGGGAAHAREIRELREELNWYYHRIEQDEAGPEVAPRVHIQRLHGEAQLRERRLKALLRELPLAAADQSMPGALAPDLEAIRAALGGDTVLVEYFRTGDRILAAVLTRNSLEVAAVTTVSSVQELARMLQFQFSKFGLDAAYLARAPKLLLESTVGHLRELHAELVAPVERWLRGGKLVLVPHESLHQLPLHALFDGEKYLIDRFAVSYAPSAAVYALCREAVSPERPAGEGVSLIMGVPDARAPLIEDEVRQLADILPQPELYVGGDARREVLERRGPRSRLLHIATHGRFREDNPMFSAIRMGDGYLTLYDLYGMRLPVDLAALSGCSTGLSVAASGDELMGLVRGLLHAGARSLLLTLWDVHDRTTADFMRCFYRQYAADRNAAAALGNAVREIRAEHPHPYYWAPFVVVGG